MAEEEEKPIRVVDRRMFTPDGQLRAEFREEEPAEPAKPEPPRPSASRPVEKGKPPESGPRPAGEADPRGDFASIVRSLATTAYSALGLLADPAGGSHPDTAVARQMIDWLAVLEQKTRGNLSFEESDFLSRLLYELRLAFVEVTRPPAK